MSCRTLPGSASDRAVRKPVRSGPVLLTVPRTCEHSQSQWAGWLLADNVSACARAHFIALLQQLADQLRGYESTCTCAPVA